MEYLASPVIVVISYPCVGPSPRTKASFFLLSICTDELFSTPKIIAFLPQSKLGKGKSNGESSRIPYLE